MPRFALQGAALAGAGAAGAAIAVGVVAAAGGVGSTTVREVVSAVQEPDAASFAASARPRTIHDLYERAAPGVVQVTGEHALGSGFVIDKAGHIVTNEHVVRGLQHVYVSFSNNERLIARIVGRDPATDVAVLQVKTRSRALMPLSLGNSDAVQVGDAVVAIGNPLGEDRSIASGIVSSLRRRFDVIETDVTLDHGDSGGPLLNARGDVIGVNGVGFAIPIDTVKNVAAQLIAKGSVEHPFIGIDARAITPHVAALFKLPVRRGLLVGGVCKTSGAARAGVHGATTHVTLAGDTWPLGGDIIVKADGARVGSLNELRSIVGDKEPGETLELELYRGSKTLDTKVRLGRQPAVTLC